MRTSIEVKNKSEAQAVRAALDDPATRAFVLVIGYLQQLPTDRARLRVLRYVEELITDPEWQGVGPRAHDEQRLHLADAGASRE